MLASVPSTAPYVDPSQLQSRTGPLAALFGSSVTDALASRRIVMVGAGALGCEFLKLFALLGVATAADGQLLVADNDEISESNLHRQFLFRPQDCGRPKATVAAKAAKRICSAMKVDARQAIVTHTTRKEFNDALFDEADEIVSAVDSAKARVFLDSMSRFYGKIMFDSGTEGLKCSTGVFIPNYTGGYVVPTDPDLAANCTGKRFPFRSDHCIQWAVEHYTRIFDSSLLPTENAQSAFVGMFQSGLKASYADHPPDERLPDGRLFWSGLTYPTFLQWNETDSWTQLFRDSYNRLCTRRTSTAKAIPFEKDDMEIVDFVSAVGNLFCRSFQLPEVTDVLEVRRMAGSMQAATVTSTAIAAGLTALTMIKVRGKKTQFICFLNFLFICKALERDHLNLASLKSYAMDCGANLFSRFDLSRPPQQVVPVVPSCGVLTVCAPTNVSVAKLCQILRTSFLLEVDFVTLPDLAGRNGNLFQPDDKIELLSALGENVRSPSRRYVQVKTRAKKIFIDFPVPQKKIFF